MKNLSLMVTFACFFLFCCCCKRKFYAPINSSFVMEKQSIDPKNNLEKSTTYQIYRATPLQKMYYQTSYNTFYVEIKEQNGNLRTYHLIKKTRNHFQGLAS